MAVYTIFPAVDAGYSFPPLVRRAIAASPEIAEEFANQIYGQVNAAVDVALSQNATVVNSVNTAVNDSVNGLRLVRVDDNGVASPIIEHADWAHVVTDDAGYVFAGVRANGTHYIRSLESPNFSGNTSLVQLNDVAIAATPAEGQVLTYQTGFWRSVSLPPRSTQNDQVVYRNTSLAAAATPTRIATTSGVNPRFTIGRIQGSIIAGGSGSISRVITVDVYIAWNGTARSIIDKSAVIQVGDHAVDFVWVLLAGDEIALDANYATGVNIDVVASIRLTGLVP